MKRFARALCRMFTLFIPLPLAFCSTQTNTPAGGAAKEFGAIVSYAELLEWLDDTQAETIIVDIRRDDEVASGMVPGAAHIPLADLNARIHELPKDARIVLYCRSGARVQTALPIFKEAGYMQVYNFVSISNWQGQLEIPL